MTISLFKLAAQLRDQVRVKIEGLSPEDRNELERNADEVWNCVVCLLGADDAKKLRDTYGPEFREILRFEALMNSSSCEAAETIIKTHNLGSDLMPALKESKSNDCRH